METLENISKYDISRGNQSQFGSNMYIWMTITQINYNQLILKDYFCLPHPIQYTFDKTLLKREHSNITQ